LHRTQDEHVIPALKWQKARQAQARQVRAELMDHSFVTDPRFDTAAYPPEIVELSAINWTRVFIAVMAARMLATSESTRVLDVGSGCGKFCIVAALTCPGQFTGIEIREDLHAAAVKAAEDLQADNAHFLLGDMADLDWSDYDSYYFYNPFYGKLVQASGGAEFLRQTQIVQERLRSRPRGTRVVTHHGFGGDMPAEYERSERHLVGAGILELWIRR
jgi:predicted RNA methylase